MAGLNDRRAVKVENRLRTLSLRCHVAIDALDAGRMIDGLAEIDELAHDVERLQQAVAAWGWRNEHTTPRADAAGLA